MGERVSDETVVAAPAETVWEVITDLEAYPEWADGVEEVEVLDADVQGRPTSARFVVDARIMTVRYTLAYSYGEDNMSWHLTEAEQLSQLDGEYRVTPDGEASRVRYVLDVDVAIPVPAFVKRRAAKQILETGLLGLKRRAEAGA